jgi:Tol biopolymer transport system component
MRGSSYFTYSGFVFRFTLMLCLGIIFGVGMMIGVGQVRALDEGVLAFSMPIDRLRAWKVFILDVRTRRMIEVMNYGWRVAADLQWSPDGRYLALATTGPQSDLYIVDIYHGKRWNITRDYATDQYPTWSPDGQRLAFYSTRSDGLHFDVYLIDSDGSNLRRLTFSEGGYPAWSPDGSQIVFSARLEGNLYITDVDSGSTRQLTDTPGDDRNPIWSPDGSQIAYISFVNHDRMFGYRIFVINADGSNNRMLSPELPAQGMPSWSPDGQYLAFIGRVQGEHHDSVYLVDTQHSSLVRKLADNAYYAYTERWPMWSPDGRYLAFSMRDANGLYTVDVANGSIRELSSLSTMYPVWQPRVQ